MSSLRCPLRAALAALALLLPEARAQASTLYTDLSMPATIGGAASGTDATAEAIRALDTDRSGKVEKAEVEAFARSQGLSAEEARAEFRSLDTDGSGELEASEIRNTLYDKGSAPAPKVPLKAAAAPAVAAHGTSQLQAVELEAELHAGKALAEVFARTAAKALQSRSEDAVKATKLEEAAKALRGQTAELRRTAAAQTAKAAREAAQAVFQQAEGQVKALEKEAAELERQAADHRAQAKEAMAKVLAAQAEMTSSVQQLRGQETA